LDKGQREDWFSSVFIMRLAIISAISLIAFVFVELKSRDPILNLREFKDISFTSANIIQCVSFFVLFGCILLLPLFVQQLMGYNAFLAGMALAPGGIATLFTMPIAGKLMQKYNPKAILASGIVITAYSVLIMSRFNLYIDFNTISSSRIVMGIGMGLIFVPLASMAFSTIKKEEMGNATSIFNLLRNIAGSFGVATMTTLLARRAQFHQFRFAERLNPFNYNYQMGMYKAGEVLIAKTGRTTSASANGVIYQELLKQSNLFSFTDAFYFATVLLICILPVVLLLKRPRHGQAAAMVH
jgi:DHA2 family multidrug resistance protein